MEIRVQEQSLLSAFRFAAFDLLHSHETVLLSNSPVLLDGLAASVSILTKERTRLERTSTRCFGYYDAIELQQTESGPDIASFN